VFSLYLLKRLVAQGRFRKVLVERLSEPLHLNLASAFVAAFGSFRRKVDFDLIVRPQFAFPILYAADRAKARGYGKITIAEFGVGSGAGLMNMCKIAGSVMAETGTEIEVVGFDTGTGMPPGIDYRDHPEIWQPGDFPMDQERLRAALPPFARLVLGNAEQTVPEFVEALSPSAPLAFFSVDVDYYSSSVSVLKVLGGSPDKYLPFVMIYLDDITVDEANPWCGELLAVNEFNAAHETRKIAPFPLLRAKRLLKNAMWIDQVYVGHIFDHAMRSFSYHSSKAVYAPKNEYL